MGKGYREGSRIGKTLDYLARNGVDCVKIGYIKAGLRKPMFLPLNISDKTNFMERLYRAGGRIVTDDYIEIESDVIRGREIKELNPKLKLEADKLYKVLRMSYL